MSMKESPCIPPGTFAGTAKVTRCQVRPASLVMATTDDPGAERASDLLVAEIRPRVQQQHLALLGVQRRERPRDPRRKCCGDHPFVGRISELGRGRQRERVTRYPRVELQQLLLVPPVPAQDVGGDAVQPGPQRPALRLVCGPPPVRCREHLGRQVLGQGLAHAPGDEPVHRGEVLQEHGLKVVQRRDGPSRSFPVHE